MPTTTRNMATADSPASVEFITQMDSYIQSSEIFKKVLVEALNSALQETLTPLYAEIKSLKSEVLSLRSELSEVKAKANDNEQYSRRNNIRIFGLGEENNENCYDVVLRLCDELNLDVKRNELDRVHRVGRARNMTLSSSNPVHPRPMIVKLTGHQSKLKFMKAKKHLRRNVSIKEDLTRENYELLKYVKTNSLKDVAVYTIDAVIMARAPGHDKPCRIYKKEDLATFKLHKTTPAADD